MAKIKRRPPRIQIRERFKAAPLRSRRYRRPSWLALWKTERGQPEYCDWRYAEWLSMERNIELRAAEIASHQKQLIADQISKMYRKSPIRP